MAVVVEPLTTCLTVGMWKIYFTAKNWWWSNKIAILWTGLV